jgi:3-oxoacyl-[acyl-carrier-protein] synthase II
MVPQSDPIVVTGMGAVSPLGVGVDVNWERLTAGKSGVVPNTRFDTSAYACRIAGLVPSKTDDPQGFDPLMAVTDAKDLKKMDYFIQYGLTAAAEAIAQSGWEPKTDAEKQGTATIIASGVGGSPVMHETSKIIIEKGPRRVGPFTIPSFLANLAAGWISIRWGFKGPIGTPVTACAASSQAIGDGMRLIITGEADVAVVGGAEGSVDPLSISGFSAARTLSTNNDNPAKASRPFDKDRDGFVLAEGSAVLVIERLSHARARGATPLAVIAGYGTAADAYHVTSGDPTGAGARAAMTRALAMAGLSPGDIDYINAHATSTAVGDAAEIASISSLFTNRGKDLSISSTKSSTGHLLGAAGAIEAIYSVLALRNGLVPATLNLEEPDVGDKFDLVPKVAKAKTLRHALSNSFGFGGVNASLVFSAA